MRSSTPVSDISRPALQVGVGALVVGVAIVFAVLGPRLAAHDPLDTTCSRVLEDRVRHSSAPIPSAATS